MNLGTLRRLLAVLLVALFVASCGSSGESSSPSASSDATRTVRTDKGQIAVPRDPGRVVSADFYGAFTLVDVGVRPVGVVGKGYQDQPKKYATSLAKAKTVGDFEELDYEAILAAKPDVIVRTVDTDATMYKRLSDIAPTIVISFESKSLTTVTQRIGTALGQASTAKKAVSAYEKQADRVKTKHATTLRTTTFALVTPTGEGDWWLYGRSWTDLTVLTRAGARLAPPSDTQKKQTTEHSMEDLGILKRADVLLIDPTWDNKTMTGSRLWARLPAVRADRVHNITTGTSSVGIAQNLLTTFDKILTRVAA